jgi:hypothetical protein
MIGYVQNEEPAWQIRRGSSDVPISSNCGDDGECHESIINQSRQCGNTPYGGDDSDFPVDWPRLKHGMDVHAKHDISRPIGCLVKIGLKSVVQS